MKLPTDLVKLIAYHLPIVEAIGAGIVFMAELTEEELGTLFRERLNRYFGKELANRFCTYLRDCNRRWQTRMAGSLVLKLITDADFEVNNIDVFCLGCQDREPTPFDTLPKISRDVDNISPEYRFFLKNYKFCGHTLKMITVHPAEIGEMKTIDEYVRKCFDISCYMATFDGKTLKIPPECREACLTEKVTVKYDRSKTYSTVIIWKYNRYKSKYISNIILDGQKYVVPTYLRKHAKEQ